MQTFPSACDSCSHRITEFACEAFDIIPVDIICFGDPHNEPIPGQLNDVVWDFAPGTEQEFDIWKAVIESPV